MALPKIDAPTFEITLPISKKLLPDEFNTDETVLVPPILGITELAAPATLNNA